MYDVVPYLDPCKIRTWIRIGSGLGSVSGSVPFMRYEAGSCLLYIFRSCVSLADVMFTPSHLGPHTLLSRTFSIPERIRQYLTDTSLEEVTFQYTDPIHAMVSMLHFNPLAADWDNLCFTYEDNDYYDDFCNGDRMKRIQESIPSGTAQLNAVMYFDGIQQDETGFVSVDGGIILGAFFRKEAREQNEAMRSICSFVEVRCSAWFA